MDAKARDYLDHVVKALQHLWLENVGMKQMLEKYAPQGWEHALRIWCEVPENQAQAAHRFDLARALLQSAQTDSAVLEELSKALEQTGKSN